MARTEGPPLPRGDAGALCDRLFASFLAPLVLGGVMRPAKAFGGKNALAFGEGRAPADFDTFSRTELARVRVC